MVLEVTKMGLQVRQVKIHILTQTAGAGDTGCTSNHLTRTRRSREAQVRASLVLLTRRRAVIINNLKLLIR